MYECAATVFFGNIGGAKCRNEEYWNECNEWY